MSAIELIVDPSPVGIDLRLADCDSLDDFEDEVRALLRERARVVVSLHPAPSAAVTVPEAMRALVKTLREVPGGSVRCLLASERARRAAAPLVPELARPPRQGRVGALDVIVLQGDIATVEADGIVNASNVRLELGAGVSGALAKAVAHPDALQADMRSRAPIEPGQVVATNAHGLRSTRLLLHAATASGDEDAVARAYREALDLAERLRLQSLALPSLGSGTGGLAPVRSAALLRDALEARESFTSLRRVLCVLYDGETADIFAERLLPPRSFHDSILACAPRLRREPTG
ncbi:MAG: macro domain-containing protein [Sandaracinaceae bacterium]|nr:macro domain-containing protein [Sandaracinaceae bacterium]